MRGPFRKEKQAWVQAQEQCILDGKKNLKLMIKERDNILNANIVGAGEWAKAQQSLIDEQTQDIERMAQELEQMEEEF